MTPNALDSPPAASRTTRTNWRDGFARDLMSGRMVEQQAGGRGDGGDRADLRLHRHRRWFGRLRGGLAPFRIRPPSRAPARSRSTRPQPLDPHPPRLRQDLCRSDGQLAVRDRAAAAARQSPPVPAARQDAGRIQLDQRHGVYRGNHGDYDEWRQRGCEGWDWDSVLPYFKKAQNQTRGADDFHGVGGPLHVSDQPGPFELADAVLEACVQAGIPRNPDFNGAQQEGCGYYRPPRSSDAAGVPRRPI